MIVYNVLEEIRIIIYLIALGIFIISNYDILLIVKSTHKYKNLIIKIIYVCLMIIVSYYFVYRLKEGYLPQYSIGFVLLGIIVYQILIRNKFIRILTKISAIKDKIIKRLMKILKPLGIFKETILLIKRKNKKLNIKTLYKKKKL